MNTNCLIGIKCPSCGSEGPFFIEVQALALMWDDGSESNIEGNLNWGTDSYMRCYECDEEGQVKDFRIAQPPEQSEIQTFADAILRVVSGQTEEQ